MFEVYLKKGEDKRIREGHAWIYANEVARIDGKDKNGTIAFVYAANGDFLGKGFINHLSKILVRIITRDKEEVIDKDFFVRRIRHANDLRKSLGYDNAYRAVFAEADDLPALIVDKYDDILSIQILSYGMNRIKSVLIDALIEVFNPRGIYERSDVVVREKEGLQQFKGVVYGEFSPIVNIYENGLNLTIDVENGQKTGYFLDQKENRYAIKRYAKDRTVLDCFSNIGGFALNGAAAGAKNVTALDISQKAVDSIKNNSRQNNLIIDAICCDVFDKLREYKKNGIKFDMIVLDPPAFCKSASEIKDALRGYKDINILAMKLLNEGGILATCSCSHYVTMQLFENMLTEAAKEAHKSVLYLERRTQSPDHPSKVGSDETLYLKFYILKVDAIG